MLDVLFVNGNAASKIYQNLAKSYSAIEPPIWAMLLANHVRLNGFSCEILDCEAERLTLAESVQRIKDADARLVVFVIYGQQPSASTQNMQGATELASALKSDDGSSRVMFIGAHVAALPSEVLAYDFVDFVAQNEGVYTLSGLLETDLKTDLQKIQGLGWKSGGIATLNPIGIIVPQNKLGEDLPGQSWDLININRYRTANWHVNYGVIPTSPFGSLYTSLGCPWKCQFCCINIINRTDSGLEIAAADSAVFRHWEPEFIIQAFDKMAELGIKNVKIADELFLARPSHFLKLCDLLIERDYGFNIWCYSRVDTAKEKYMEKLKAAGINWVGLGIESANRTIRQEVTKGRFEDVDIKQIVDRFKSYGVNVGANFIFGLEGETFETMEETLQLAIELNAEYSNFYCAMAYPGSPLHIQAKKSGISLPPSFDGYSQHSYNCFPLSGKYLTNSDILRFRDAAWYRYNTRPEYLNFIGQKFGEVARQHLEDLAKIRLRRRLLED